MPASLLCPLVYRRFRRLAHACCPVLSCMSTLMAACVSCCCASRGDGLSIARQDAFEIGRRYKIQNPHKMRSEYGKLMYLLMDRCGPARLLQPPLGRVHTVVHGQLSTDLETIDFMQPLAACVWAYITLMFPSMHAYVCTCHATQCSIGHVSQTMTAVCVGQRGPPGAARSQRRRSCWSSAACARCARSTSCCRMRTASLCSQARRALLTMRTWCLLRRPPWLQARTCPPCQATRAWHVRLAVVRRTCTHASCITNRQTEKVGRGSRSGYC